MNHQSLLCCPAASDLVHKLLLLLDELHGGGVSLIHQLSDLLVDELSRGLAVRLLGHHFALPRQVERHLAHLVAHAKLHHLQAETGTTTATMAVKTIWPVGVYTSGRERAVPGRRPTA